MLPDMPPPNKRPLSRSPLVTAVCQVKFEEIVAVSEPRTMLAFQNELGGRTGAYPRSEHLASPTITIRQIGNSLPQPSLEAVQHGWRLVSADGAWAVTLMPDNVALETTHYMTWDGDFRERLRSVLAALSKSVSPATEQRLGLRYVNQIAHPPVKASAQWEKYIAPELLGAVLHNHLGPRVAAAQQQFDLDCGDDIKCGLRHGFADPRRTNGSFVYLIDIDVYREDIHEFDPDDSEVTATEFNDISVQIFRECITDHLYDILSSS